MKQFLFFVLTISIIAIIPSCKPKPTETTQLETKISGRVTDKATNVAITGALITTNPTTSSISTDASGNYTIKDVTKGQYLVTATKDGYKSNSISVVAIEGKNVSADIQLQVLGPELSVSASAVDFGTSQTTASLILGNTTGVGTLTYSLSNNAAWLNASPTSGSITTGTNTITLTANRTGLSYGNYNTVLTITSSGGNKDIAISLVVQNPNAPQLTVTPLLLNFGETQTSLTFSITNTGTGRIDWNASAAQNWLFVSPLSDSTRTELDVVTVTVNRSGLTPSSYNGQITVTSNAGNQTVNVQMTVAATPVLSLSTNQLDFDSNKTQLSFTVSNGGSGTLNWSGSKNQSWITVYPTSGTNLGTVNVTISRSGLTTGNYSGIVSINSNGGNGSVNIAMYVVPPTPPQAVTLTDPTNITTNSMTLAWTRSTESDFAAYRLYRSTSPAVNENSTLVTTITDKNSNSYNVTGLSSNTTYYFRVYVMNNSQLTTGSNTVNGTTNPQLKSWSLLSTVPNSPTIYGLFVNSENDIWVCTYYNGVYNYDGSTWRKVFFPDSTSTLFEVSFIHPNAGWIIGENGIYKYNGIQWSKVNNNSYNYSLITIDTNDVWVGSSNGRILHWNGTAWNTFTVNGSNINGLSFVSQNEGYAISSEGKFFSYNGIGWSLQGSYTSSINPNRDEFVTLNSNDMWSAGGSLYHYDGSNWSQYIDPITNQPLNYIYSIDMVSSNYGWIGGYSGALYYYNGTRWLQVNSPTSNTIYKIQMINANDGWAVGSSGVVLRYH